MSFILVTSCNYFDKQKVYTEDLLEEELQTFNWNDVDEYPSFASCDSVLTKTDKKLCFQNTLREILNSKLDTYRIVVSEAISDTILLKITIDKEGVFQINEIQSKPHTKSQIPELDSLLTHSFDSLPKIYPAIKRSQEVATQFSFPVVVNIN